MSLTLRVLSEEKESQTKNYAMFTATPGSG